MRKDKNPSNNPEREAESKKNTYVQTDKRGKILVMDDEEFIQEILNEMLKLNGYTVELSSDGDSAIRKYKDALDAKEPFECIILDLTIPGKKGGKDTISEIKSFDPNVSAIVTSGYSNDPVMEQYSQYGFKAILSKPFSIDELLKTIAEITHHDLHHTP
ncbi:MAG: response regulator [Fibrobacterales bacterium]